MKTLISKNLKQAQAALRGRQRPRPEKQGLNSLQNQVDDMQSRVGAASNDVASSPTNTNLYSPDVASLTAEIAGASATVARVPVLAYDANEIRFNNLPFSHVAETDIDALRYIYGRAAVSNRLTSLVGSLPPETPVVTFNTVVVPDTNTEVPVTTSAISATGTVASGWKTGSVPFGRSGALDKGGTPVVVPLIRIRVAMQSQYGVLTNIKIRLRGIFDSPHSPCLNYITLQSGVTAQAAGTPITSISSTIHEGVSLPDLWETGYFNIEPARMDRTMSFLLHPFDIFEGKTYIQPVVVQGASAFTYTPAGGSATNYFNPGATVELDAPLRPDGCSLVVELITSLHPEFYRLKREMLSKVIYYQSTDF